MLTIFTTAKRFHGHNRIIQKNALMSWLAMHQDVEVILFGDDEGAAETAKELGIRHLAGVERVNGREKVLRSFFDAAQQVAKNDLICYANCDIVLPRDFLCAVNVVDAIHGAFLMVGRRWNVDVDTPIEFQDRAWETELTKRATETGRPSSGDWIDYFVFRKGFYLGRLPEFVIGRVYWDQWLVWKARQVGAEVVDASSAVMAIHQNHDYGYHPAGRAGVWSDELSRRNYRLSGGRWHLRTIEDATQVLGRYGLQANPAQRKRAIQRTLRTAKDAVWISVLDWTRPMRRAVGIGGR